MCHFNKVYHFISIDLNDIYVHNKQFWSVLITSDCTEARLHGHVALRFWQGITTQPAWGKCLCKPFCWKVATSQKAKSAARTIPPTLFLMVVHRGNNRKKAGSLCEWLLTFVSPSNRSLNAGQFRLNMLNCGDKMWDLPFSMHIKDTCHQDVTQELWEQEVQFLWDRLTHHQNHEIRPRKISLWWEKCYTLVHFAYKKNWKGCM